MEYGYWKSEAVKDLRRYGNLENSMANIRAKIQLLEDSVTGISLSYDRENVQGGGTTQEDKLNNYLTKKIQLESQLQLNIKDYELTGKVLGQLTADDRDILTRAYIWPQRNHMYWIMKTYHVEKTKAYEMRLEALSAFIKLMYGIEK